VQDVVPLPEAMATLPFSEKTQDGDTLTLRVATGHAVVVSAALRTRSDQFYILLLRNIVWFGIFV
jgi:hypothetical protein